MRPFLVLLIWTAAAVGADQSGDLSMTGSQSTTSAHQTAVGINFLKWPNTYELGIGASVGFQAASVLFVGFESGLRFWRWTEPNGSLGTITVPLLATAYIRPDLKGGVSPFLGASIGPDIVFSISNLDGLENRVDTNFAKLVRFGLDISNIRLETKIGDIGGAFVWMPQISALVRF